MLKPMWRQPFKKRRCLVPADAFYEWKKIDAKTKQPFAFSMKDDAPFAFAGVWERWIVPDKKPVDSFAIITTDPNELAATVHTRMPVILELKDYTRWLTRADEEQPPVDLLRPYDADLMKAWKVGPDLAEQRGETFSRSGRIDVGGFNRYRTSAFFQQGLTPIHTRGV